MSAVVGNRPAWPRLLPGLLLLAALLWLLRDTAAGMVEIWARSETFTHAFLVPPIVAWLVWRRRALLATLPVRPMPAMLPAIALVCFGWVLAALAAVDVAAHFALVTLIVLSVPAVFGMAVARALTFPLLFLYFAVPFGQFTAPQLMEWTADFTVLALRATGIPVYREGMQFVIPSGNWSVVEACSGVRYLIASFMVGTLYAYLNYRSTRRRVVFMLFSLVVPLVANWLRAYMIVMIGHLSGNTLAVGVDHLLYGWVFFGVVMGLLYFIGSYWAEPDEAPPAAPAAGVPVPAAASAGQWTTAAVAAALVLAAQAWVWRLDHPDALPAPALAAPALAGWQQADEPLPWPHGILNPSTTAASAYKRDGTRVWAWIGYYRQQDDDRRLVSSIHRLIELKRKDWSLTATGGRAPAGELPGFRTASLREGGTLGLGTGRRMRVWQVYWIGGRWTASAARAKLWQAFDRLLGRGDDGAVLLLATPLAGDADATLEKFAREHLGAVAASLEAARESR